MKGSYLYFRNRSWTAWHHREEIGGFGVILSQLHVSNPMAQIEDSSCTARLSSLCRGETGGGSQEQKVNFKHLKAP